jgi:NAD(P)H-flavin reductase
MHAVKYKTTLHSVRELSDTLREYSLDLPGSTTYDFEAGQFMMLTVPEKETGKEYKRAYSIAGRTEDHKHIHFIVRLFEDGHASNYFKSLHVGDQLELTGPFGKVTFSEPPAKQVIFMATGAGLSQHYSIIASHAKNYPESEFKLYLGLWNEDELYFKEELDKIKAQSPNFDYEYVLDKSNGVWAGRTGHITQCLDDFDMIHIPTQVYICGNPRMIDDVTISLADRGVSRKNIFTESFFHN